MHIFCRISYIYRLILYLLVDFFEVVAVGFLKILNAVSCWHCSIVILFYMFYLGLIVVMVVFWWYVLSNWWTCVFSICCFLCWICVCCLSFLYLGMLVLCGYLPVIFGTCVWYLSFLHLGMYVVRLLVHLGFGFLFLIWGYCFVFILICSLVFFTCDSCFTWEMFLLLVTLLCLIVFTWACPSVSCRLWVFSMGRICIAIFLILAQVTHVWLIVSFLVGRHFGLVGIETFVEGLGLPLTWSTAVLDVLPRLPLFSVFFCKSNLHWFPYSVFFALFCTCYATFVEGSLEVKLPTIWTDEKQSRAEAERRERLEERRVEEKESEERRCRWAKR